MNKFVGRSRPPRPLQPYALQLAAGPRQPTPTAAAPKPQPGSDLAPSPDYAGSVLCLAGLAATAYFLRGTTPEDIARFAAVGVLASLGVSMAFDLRRGVQNLVRTDLIALMALYFLTLAEFLVRQDKFNTVAGLHSTRLATLACICGYAGMVVGRHLVPPTRKHPFQAIFLQPAPSAVLFSIFWACFLIGYLNMLISVNFSVSDMVSYFLQPRFAQPWQRGSLGDWKAMLYETSEILYLVPPLGGILIARRQKYPKFQVFLVMLGVLFTMFYGFSSGTRNIFASYLVTFMIGYGFALNRRKTKEIAFVAICCAVALVISTRMMLDFRDVGLEDYVAWQYYKEGSHPQEAESLAVDHNLYAISRMVEYFPAHHPFTGLEIPYMAIIHPIPRVLWPTKPEGLSVTVEAIVGANGWTVATSVIGEEYIMGGFTAVFLMSIVFGACCAWWNLLASPRNSEFGILVYASGFFSAVITMRSMNWFSTALLPTMVGLAIGYACLLRYRKQSPVEKMPSRRFIAPAPR